MVRKKIGIALALAMLGATILAASSGSVLAQGNATVAKRFSGTHERVHSANAQGRILFDRQSEQAQLVRQDGTVVALNKGRFGQIDPAGNVYVGDSSVGLHRYDAQTGDLTQLRQPGEVGLPFLLDESGQHMIYQVWMGHVGNKATYAAVGLMDTRTGEDRLLVHKPGQYVHGLGWVGNRVLIQTWEAGADAHNVWKLVDLNGNEQPLDKLKAAPLTTGWPTHSPDQQFYAFPSEQGVVVIHPASQRFSVFPDAQKAYWDLHSMILINGDQETEVPIGQVLQ